MLRDAQYQLATFGALLFDAARNWHGAVVGAAFAPALQLQPRAVARRPDEQADICRGEPRCCAVDLAPHRHGAAPAADASRYPRVPLSGRSSHSL